MTMLLRLLAEEEGATAVEYAVMLAMIILVCFSAITLVGQQTAQLWSDNDAGLQSVFSP